MYEVLVERYIRFGDALTRLKREGMEMYSGLCALIEIVMEREGAETKRRSYNDGQCCVKKSFSAPMLPRNEREGEGRQSVVTSS